MKLQLLKVWAHSFRHRDIFPLSLQRSNIYRNFPAGLTIASGALLNLLKIAGDRGRRQRTVFGVMMMERMKFRNGSGKSPCRWSVSQLIAGSHQRQSPPTESPENAS